MQGDIRSEKVADIFKEYQVDTVVHLASIVTPGKKKDREFEYSVDVLGTENVLQACIKNKVKKIIITSSGAAYGYYPDNPAWLDESDPIRGNVEFPYSYHKRLIEEMLADYRQKHPQLEQLILRPGTVLGEHTQNQITNLFQKKFVLGIVGSDSPFVFIWDQDVSNIILKGIYEEVKGVYNLAGDGFLTMKQIATILGKPYVQIPAGVLKLFLSAGQWLRLSRYGPEQINFLRFRPVLSNKRLKEEFGYVPAYTSAEVFDLYMKANFKSAK